MEEFSNSPACYYSAGVLLLFVTLVIYFVNKYTYWTQRGVPQVRPVPILGNFAEFAILKKSLSDVVVDIYNKYSNFPYIGAYFFTRPLLVVCDPDVIKCVMTKDFDHFHSRGLNVDERDRFGNHLFFRDGDNWKIWRQNLTPLFTSSKMKNMMYLMVECSRRLSSYLELMVAKNKKVDIKKITSDFTLEVIGSCAFGLQMNSMSEDNNAFRAIGRQIFQTSFLKTIRKLLRLIFPWLYYALHLKFNDSKVETFISNLVTDVNNSRAGKPAIRHDLIDLLMDMRSRGYIEGDTFNRDEGKKKLEIDDVDLASQSFVFFAGGFETTSTTISFVLYELAKHRNIQTKVRKEITDQLKQTNGEISYELLCRLDYLDMVIDETLRLYPVLGLLERECMVDYKIRDSNFVLKKGTHIHIPVKALHYDPQYYENPEKFNPENFLPEVKAARHPYVYMPFGEGPRICIGLRFAKMQVKTGLITILEKFEILPTEDTPDKFDFNPQNVVIEPVGGIHLNMIPLKIQ